MSRKPMAYYLALQYPFHVTADPDGGFVISFPDLPGCMTQVERIKDVGPMAEDARQLWIRSEYDEGEDIPLPSYPQPYSGKFNARIPRTLHRKLATTAELEGVSLNQYVLTLLAGGDVKDTSRRSPRSRRAIPKATAARRCSPSP